jgi:hypothetical protein
MDDRHEGDHHDIEVEGGALHGFERKISGILDDGSVGFRQPLLARNRKNTTSQIAIVGANTCPIESLDYESVLFLPLLFSSAHNLMFRSFFWIKFLTLAIRL